jgi:hypothetical protein
VGHGVTPFSVFSTQFLEKKEVVTCVMPALRDANLSHGDTVCQDPLCLALGSKGTMYRAPTVAARKVVAN